MLTEADRNRRYHEPIMIKNEDEEKVGMKTKAKIPSSNISYRTMESTYMVIYHDYSRCVVHADF